MEYLNTLGENAAKAMKELARLNTKEKNLMLVKFSAAVSSNRKLILDKNKSDIEKARQNGLKDSLIDRLTLNDKRIDDIVDSFIQISKLSDPIGEIVSMRTMENGLTIGKRRVGIGVIGIIYESRPNVTADAFSLCFKVSSCVILRGGKEAINSNKVLVDIFRNTLAENGYNPDFVQLIEDLDRNTTVEFMKLNKYVDVLIPRGSASLIQTTINQSTIPTIETGVGNCHIFVDESADLSKATAIIINAKTQRLGVCNACESLLIHKNIAEKYVPVIAKKLQDKGVEIRGDETAQKLADNITPATDDDYAEEFLDLIISLKVVNDLDEAITHISHYGTKHSEAIITESYTNSRRFLDEVDAAAVYVNASTRFTDGYEFGLGAEIGISTQKLHARGPMGLEALTTTKYIIQGDGQIRE